jgi:hypothetical protein
VVLSFTTDGALGETGSIYLVGEDPHPTLTGRRSLVIQRLPTR